MKIFGKMMNWLMLSCEEATLLMTKKQLGQLTPLKSIHLRIHLLSCSLCRRFEIQNELIQKFWKEFENTEHSLSDSKKQEIAHSLEDHEKRS